MSFKSIFDKESQAAIDACKEVVSVTAISLFSGVIGSSPVGNADLWQDPRSAPEGYTGGSFRSNWFLTRKASSVKYYEDIIVSESAKVGEISTNILSKYSSTFILTNNAPYSEAIEGGHSTQAPVGVISPNQSRVESEIPSIIRVAERKYGVN